MENINVMAIVKDYIEENRLSKASLARTLGISEKAMIKRLARDYMDCAFLFRLCKALNHDFFADLSDILEMNPKENVSELKKELETLKIEKELLLGIIEKNIK